MRILSLSDLDSYRTAPAGETPWESAIQGSTRLILSYLYTGPEEHDRDDGDCMAQIQELQEQLNRLQAVDRQPTGAVRQLAASRVAFDDIMAFDLEAQLASHETHNGYWV